jgi:hypothetical protein
VDSTDKDKSAFKSWLAWYSSPPENWNEKYGDAFVWTAQEKALMQQLKENKYEITRSIPRTNGLKGLYIF